MGRPAGNPGGPRVLVPVTYGLSVRYLLPTGLLAGLAGAVTPVVGLGWDDPVLQARIEADGVEVVRLPDAALTHDYRMYRRQVAVLHQRRLHSPTSGIQRRQRASTGGWDRARVLTGVRRARDIAVTALPGAAARLEAAEPHQVDTGTNVGEFRGLLDRAGIDGVLSVTPYHDQDGLLLWAARSTGRPSLTSVISFDNPTTRERMLARSERIVVWNRYNRDEVLRAYADLDEDRVGVVGAPQFDLHAQPRWVTDEADWRAGLGLDADRPVVLYGAGPPGLVPGEPALVEAIDRAIDDGSVPGRPLLLVRRHPSDVGDRWDAVAGRLRHGRVELPWAPGGTPYLGWPTDDDIRLQMSTLAHCAVHVNVCSSMSLDGAWFDRPQVGPTFLPGIPAAARRRVARFYRQEHWAPIARSGGVTTVDDLPELVAALGDGLQRPERLHAGRERMLDDVLTYRDGRSSERVVAEAASTFGAVPAAPGAAADPPDATSRR
jgi:hypothetical protein